MQSLSFLKRDTKALDALSSGTLRGLPDINARSPNDPTYMLSSQDVFKLITQFAEITDRSEIQPHHYAVIWAHAIKQGWKDVYMDGGQLFLVSGFTPRTPVLREVVTRRMLVTINKPTHPASANLLEHIARFDPLITAAGSDTQISKVAYVGGGQRCDLSAAYDARSHSIGAVLENGVTVVVHLGTNDVHYNDVPDDCPLEFEVEYQIQFD